MKLYRALYWICMICALLAGLYSGNRFCWLLFLVLAFGIAAALGIDLWTVFSFSYLQKLNTGQGEKGHTVLLHLSIYNDKPFPFTHMRVTVETPDPSESRVLPIDLPPRKSCSFDLTLSLTHRGDFRVGMTYLELQDVFGLLPLRFDLRRLPYYRQSSLLVLPQVYELPLPAGKAGLAPGNGRTVAGQDEFSDLRPWQPGDSLSRIQWKTLAQSRELLTRRYEDPAGGSCLLFLDCRALSEDLSERLTDCAATLAYDSLSQGNSVLLSESLPAAMDKRAVSLADLTALRQRLAVLRFDGSAFDPEQLTALLSKERWSTVTVLGGRLDPEICAALKRTEAVCRYFLAEKTEGNRLGNSHVKIRSLSDINLREFLSEQLREEP